MQLMEVHMQFNLGIFGICKDKWGAIYGYFKHFDYMLNIGNNSEYWTLIPQEKTMFNLP
jgi:hypothetical protein